MTIARARNSATSGVGLTNTAIAEKLVPSQKTIHNQVSNIYSKLQVATHSEAIFKAREAGLGH